MSRTFRADRITAVAPADEPSDAAEPAAYDDPSHPLVEVRLTDRGARIAQSDPHLGPHVAGAGMISFRCPLDELAWFARYFGGMGEDAHVEGPPELIARILANAQSLCAQYGG
jgi:predicted DNA-binding transcriptional regulator YafY